MILAQVYKTNEGAAKRARFENAFNERRGQYYWRVVAAYTPESWSRGWQVERITQEQRAQERRARLGE